MRTKFSYAFLLLGIALLWAACNKVDDLPSYQSGTAPSLSYTSVGLAQPAPADSDKTVLTMFWSNPRYATDSSKYKYTIQIDSTGKNFSRPLTKIVTGTRTATFTAKEINNWAVGRGYAFNVPLTLQARVVSSYSNNNERLASNIVSMPFTPYVVPPKVTPPSSKSLFLVGNATAGGWGNPVPLPAQKFTRVDSVTYQGTFYLNGGAEYLMLPVNGDWTHKYSVADNSVAGLNAGGSFGADLSSNFPGPSKTGLYKITVDFQHGTFTVVPVKLYSLLYMPGDYQGWNPANAPALGSPNSDNNYETYVNIPAGGTYEFKLTNQPDWNGTIYGDGGSGSLSTSGGNLTFPGAGFYQVKANTSAKTWSVLKTTWSLIGDFNGWSSDADMTYDAGNKLWKATINVPSNGAFKFRANHDWALNYGDTGADGSLEVNGDNVNITAGSHTISLFLNNAGYYTYMIQ